MAVKAVEIVRRIREKHYEETKGLSVEDQVAFFKKKSEKLQEELKIAQHSIADSTAQTI
jgi:hypothetical protein